MEQFQEVFYIERKQEGEDRKNRAVIIAENIPKLMRYMKPQIQKAQRTPSRINTKNIYI